jgi:hypothetical protein
LLSVLVAFAAIAQPEIVLGGQKQVIFGLKPEAALVLSHYLWIEEGKTPLGQATNVYAQKIGYTATRVSETVFNNQRVFLYVSDARVKKDPLKEYDAGVGASEQAWIDPENGHILKQVFQVEMPRTGIRKVEAVYGTQTVELSITEDGKTRDTTLYIEGGCQPFFDRFKPMVADGKVVLKEKSYLTLNPYNLSYVKGSASVGGRFDTTILLKKMKGNLYSVYVEGKRQRVYVTDKNDLVKVDLTDETYLQTDAVPEG